MRTRVVITGLGVVSPIGYDIQSFWNGLLVGKDGISDVSFDGMEDCYSKKYGMLNWKRVRELEDGYLSDSEKKLRKCSKIAMISAVTAMQDANLKQGDYRTDRMGVVLGTTQGEQYTFMEKETDSETERFSFAVDVAKHFDAHGEVFVNTNACAAGNCAIAYATELIRNNRMDCVITGGVDVFSEITYAGFNRLKALSDDEIKPFDNNRNGTILSEGAAILILESLEHACARGARIYGEIAGYGISNDAYHITAPDPSASGVIYAMEQALSDAEVSYKDIDYVALHGTGTLHNDMCEMRAMKEVFREHCKDIYASAIKGNIGHSLGAASATAMIVCALIIEKGNIPGTIHVKDLETECDFKLLTQGSQSADVRIAMNNAYAFGGSNCCIVIRKLVD